MNQACAAREKHAPLVAARLRPCARQMPIGRPRSSLSHADFVLSKKVTGWRRRARRMEAHRILPTRVAAAVHRRCCHVGLNVFIAYAGQEALHRVHGRARDASPGARVRPPRSEQGRQKVFEMRSEGDQEADSSFRSNASGLARPPSARCKSRHPPCENAHRTAIDTRQASDV